jgi:lactoylglutathione lyase
VEIVLEVPDVDAAYEQARSAGAEIAERPRLQPWGLRDFRLADPDGYYVRVTSV